MNKYLFIYFSKTAMQPKASIVDEIELQEDKVLEYADNNDRFDDCNIVIINTKDNTWCNSNVRKSGQLQWLPVSNPQSVKA